MGMGKAEPQQLGGDFSVFLMGAAVWIAYHSIPVL